MRKLNKSSPFLDFAEELLPDEFDIQLVNISDIPRQFAERKSGPWYGWKNSLLKKAHSDLSRDKAIEIEAHSHSAALALRKDMGTIASRISRDLHVMVRGSKVYIARQNCRDRSHEPNA